MQKTLQMASLTMEDGLPASTAHIHATSTKTNEQFIQLQMVNVLSIY